MYLLRHKAGGGQEGGVEVVRGVDGLNSSSLSKMLFVVLACCRIRSTMDLHRENVLHSLTCKLVE